MRIYEILLFVSTGSWFAATHTMPVVIGFLIGSVVISLTTALIKERIDQSEDQALDANRKLLLEVIPDTYEPKKNLRLLEEDERSEEKADARKKALKACSENEFWSKKQKRFYLAMCVTVVAAACINIIESLGRWISGAQNVSHAFMTVNSLMVWVTLMMLTICVRYKYRYDKDMLARRTRNRAVMHALHDYAAIQLDQTNAPEAESKQPHDVPVKGANANEEKTARLRSKWTQIATFHRKARKGWRKKALDYVFLPVWNTLATVFPILFFINAATHYIGQLPTVFSFHPPWPLLIVELAVSFLIAVTYTGYRIKDNWEDITLNQMKNKVVELEQVSDAVPELAQALDARAAHAAHPSYPGSPHGTGNNAAATP